MDTWKELESKFFSVFGESIESEDCVERYGEARTRYGLTQILNRAARGKMPDKSAVSYAIGIMENTTEEEATRIQKKPQRTSVQELGWWKPLHQKLSEMERNLQIPYLGQVYEIQVSEIQEKLKQFESRQLNREWQHWLMVITYHLLLSHLYTPNQIAVHCARLFPEYLPSVEEVLRPGAAAAAATMLAQWIEKGHPGHYQEEVSQAMQITNPVPF